MSKFDQREKDLEALERGELIYCKFVKTEFGDACSINHCHLCNKKTDNPCCCAECCIIAASNWERHYDGHIMEKIIDQSCKFCMMGSTK